MSNRVWKTLKVDVGNITEESLKKMIGDIAKIDAKLAKRLAGLPWKKLAASLIKDALKATASQLGATFKETGQAQKGKTCLGTVEYNGGRGCYSGITYSVYQDGNGNVSVRCQQYDHVSDAANNEVTKAFQKNYRAGLTKAVVKLIAKGGKTAVQEKDGKTVIKAKVEVN